MADGGGKGSDGGFVFTLLIASFASSVSTVLAIHMAASIFYSGHLIPIEERMAAVEKLNVYVMFTIAMGIGCLPLIYFAVLLELLLNATKVSGLINWFGRRGKIVRYSVRSVSALGTRYSKGNALVTVTIGSLYVAIMSISILFCIKEDRVRIANEVIGQSLMAGLFHLTWKEVPLEASQIISPLACGLIIKQFVLRRELRYFTEMLPTRTTPVAVDLTAPTDIPPTMDPTAPTDTHGRASSISDRHTSHGVASNGGD